MGQQLRNSTQQSSSSEVDVIPIPFTELSPQQQYWVDYNVVQGAITNSDGSMTKITVKDFAEKLGVDRTTLYHWSKNIPNFWDLVSERRKVIFKGARTAKVWNAVFVAATVKLNTQAQQLWLANADPDFKIPSQKIEHEVGDSWSALMAAHRERKPTHNVIEGETVDAADTDVIR